MAREFICIGCPFGCELYIEEIAKGEYHVTGNQCKIGEVYGIKEMVNPTRIVTTTVWVENGDIPCVSVKTAEEIEKGKIGDCMKVLKGLKIEAPVFINDIIVENIVDTHVNVIATKHVERK